MPGWRATVGGRAARINLVAGGVQEVRVPEGSSTVRFGYVPPYGREALLAALRTAAGTAESAAKPALNAAISLVSMQDIRRVVDFHVSELAKCGPLLSA